MYLHSTTSALIKMSLHDVHTCLAVLGPLLTAKTPDAAAIDLARDARDVLRANTVSQIASEEQVRGDLKAASDHTLEAQAVADRVGVAIPLSRVPPSP